MGAEYTTRPLGVAIPKGWAALDALPGWGPTTVRIFLRELRGIWGGADPPLNERALRAAAHLRLIARDNSARAPTRLAALASEAGVDLRDLEAALVRLSLRHLSRVRCSGGVACVALATPPTKTS